MLLRRRRRTTHAERVRDYLDQHDGWWDAHQIAAALHLDPVVVADAAGQWVERGRVDVWSTGRVRTWRSTRHGIR